MAIAADALVAFAFFAGLAVVFLVGTALKSWVFELSPLEWGYTVVLTFSLGVLTAAVLDGDGTLELLAMIPLFLAFVFWIARLWARHRVRTLRASEA